MTFLHNISSVARYEAKTLRRSWFFRLFSIMSLIFLTFFNIGIFSSIGDEPWELVAIPSTVPLVNLYLLNIGQAIVVIFLAADFLKRDKKLDTNEVLYTRSMSNFEYIIGKTWGILRLFLGLNLIILSIGLLMNVISKTIEVQLASYVYYLAIISIPTLVFSLGFAFLLMSAIRNQPVTFLLLLGIASLDMFWLWYRAGFIFDYMAIGLPVFRSAVTGFDSLKLLISQRLLYFSLGIVMIMATILLFRRLPQSKPMRVLTVVLMTGFAGVSAVCALNVWSEYSRGLNEKKTVRETNLKYENEDFATVTDAALKVVHKGFEIDASAGLKILNDNESAITKYLFSLNPSLAVTAVTSAGKSLSFKRDIHMLEINPGRSLSPGESDSLEITYSGSISEPFCYPGFDGNAKDHPYRLAMLNVNKRQAFLTPSYVLLTPETHWYPVAGLNYYPSNPANLKTDFTRYNLSVQTGNGLVAVTNGMMKHENGSFTCRPEKPLTGLTIAVGNYLADTITVDSTHYIAWHFPGNDYYKKDLSILADTLPVLISRIMREVELNFKVKYPFNSLSLVEVPVQFHSLPRNNTGTRAEVQPMMILVPEKLVSMGNAGFGKQFLRQKKRMAKQNQIVSDKELQVRIFNNFIRNAFIAGSSFRYVDGIPINEPTRFRLGPSFYFFRNNFHSKQYPVINSVFESHLQKLTNFNRPMGIGTGLSDNARANLILSQISFSEVVAADPGVDSLRIVLTAKGDYLFNLLRQKAGINEFRTWFMKYLDDNEFRSIDLQKFDEDINREFGFSFFPYLDEWFNGKGQPGFLFSEPRVNEIIVNDRARFQVTFTATNPEPFPGLFTMAMRTGGPGQGRAPMINPGQGGPGGPFMLSNQGQGIESPEVDRIIFMGPFESKRIGIVLDRQPRMIMISTLISKNIPCEISLPVGEILKANRSAGEFSGEEKLEKMPESVNGIEKIVDNEDQGFINKQVISRSRLRRLLGIKKPPENIYRNISMMNPPAYWQPVVQNNYFGKYIRSSVYTRSGKGERKVTWTTKLDGAGYYDVYTYIGKAANRMTITGRAGGPGVPAGPGGTEGQGQGPNRENTIKDLHFGINHDEGTDEITLDYENAEGGWNNLGRYYISSDSASVVLTNKSAGKVVIGDAVKWVKAE